MLFLVLYLFCLFTALGMGLYCAWTDLRGMIIPNSAVLAVAGAFAVFALVNLMAGAAAPDVFYGHIGAGLLMFIVTFILFSLGMFGGGDAKLVSAFSLWTGFSALAYFLFWMTLAGALLGVFALCVKKAKPFKTMREGSWIARLQAGESAVPYGVAITTGAFVAFYMAGYFAPEQLSLFLM